MMKVAGRRPRVLVVCALMAGFLAPAATEAQTCNPAQLSCTGTNPVCTGNYYVNLGITKSICVCGYASYDQRYKCSNSTFEDGQSGCGAPRASCCGSCPPAEPCGGRAAC